MTTPQPPLPASPDRALPAITIDGHALFEFSMKMSRALKRLEVRFDARESSTVPFLRQTWKQVGRKPR